MEEDLDALWWRRGDKVIGATTASGIRELAQIVVIVITVNRSQIWSSLLHSRKDRIFQLLRNMTDIISITDKSLTFYPIAGPEVLSPLLRAGLFVTHQTKQSTTIILLLSRKSEAVTQGIVEPGVAVKRVDERSRPHSWKRQLPNTRGFINIIIVIIIVVIVIIILIFTIDFHHHHHIRCLSSFS